MPVAVGIWSLIVKAGSPEAFIPQADLRITNITLGAVLEDNASRSSITLTYQPPVSIDSDDEEDEEEQPTNEPTTAVLCSLTPGKIENALVDLVLEEDEEYVFEVIGKNTICLSGNYIDQTPTEQVPFNDMDDDYDSEEGAYRLEDVSSDAEIDPADIDTDSERFEEIAEEAAKSLKRAREDAMDTDEPKSVSKADKKQKKLKGENGEVVPAGESLSTASAPEKKSKKDKKAEKAAATAAPSGETKRPAEKELAGGLKIQDTKVGTGPQAKKGNRIGMRYIGKLLSNGKVFDKNTKGKPFSFRLGAGEVIKGWDEGLIGMQVGGERVLTIPAKMGYGKNGTDGIPGNSTLVFECKLVELK